ncbi:MAG: hypothetical protein A4E65_00276 [Syntrophorhabdus sp. PtaU1.Bin153]|nr:MAG: hypothetical protein A4E65_00276 [Syntrophorhabdus sp. PtaU1.Bin153]
MKREDKMSSEAPPGYADIAHHANQTPSGNENAEYVTPYLLQLSEKCFVVLNMTKLVRVIIVSLEIPIRRRCNDQVYRLLPKK